MRQTAGALVSLLLGALVALGAAAPAQAVRTWGCTAVLPGAGALPAGVRLVAVVGGEQSDPSPPAQAVPSWGDAPDQTIVTWAQEAESLTGYTWLAVASDGIETPLPGACEISIDPGVAVAPVEPPPAPTAPVPPSHLRISAIAPPVALPVGSGFVAATDGGTRVSYSHATAGDDRWLFVFLRSSGSGVPSAVTYDGLPLAQVAMVDGVSGDGSADSYAFQLANPPAGTHDVAIAMASGTLSGSVAVSWAGGQPEAVFSTTTAAADLTTTLTTRTPNAQILLAVSTYYYNANSLVTVDPPYILRLMAARHWQIGTIGPVADPGPQRITTHGPGFGYLRQVFTIAIAPK